MKIPTRILVAVVLGLQHCGSPGINGQAERQGGPADQTKAPGLRPPATSEAPSSVQIGVNTLTPYPLARRGCRPEVSPPLAAITVGAIENLEEFQTTPNIAFRKKLSTSQDNNLPQRNFDLTALHYGRGADGLAIGGSFLELPNAGSGLVVEIEGLVVGDSIRSEKLRTYLISGDQVSVLDKGQWAPVDAKWFTVVQTERIFKIIINQILVSEAWNWPVWSIRTSSVGILDQKVSVRDLGSWVTYPSQLGSDISTLVVKECTKNLDGGQVLTIQAIIDRRVAEPVVQDAVDLAYTALLQSLPLGTDLTIPLTRLSWLMTDRPGSSGFFTKLNGRFGLLNDHSPSSFVVLNPNFAADLFVDHRSKEDFYMSAIFDFFSRFIDASASPNLELASLVAAGISADRLASAFGIPAKLYFYKNFQTLIPLSKGLGGLLLGQIAPPRALLLALTEAYQDVGSRGAESMGQAFSERLRAALPIERAASLNKILPGWITEGTFENGLSPKDFDDNDLDGIPNALENLIGTDPLKSNTRGGGLGDLGRFSDSWENPSWFSKIAFEIVADGSPEDWKALIPNTLFADRDETLNSCPGGANINLYGGLRGKEDFVFSVISKGHNSTESVTWQLQIDVPSKDSHYLATFSTGSQEVRLFRAENTAEPVRVWRVNGPIGRDSWEIFMPSRFIQLDSLSQVDAGLKVRITAYAGGKVCDDTPWFTPPEVRP